MPIRCYAQRLLNPFRGVMNVIEFEAAEAVTLDGVQWDIYVRNAELVKDLAQAERVQTSDIRYGSWSAAQGLKRGPIQPSDDFLRDAEGGLSLHGVNIHLDLQQRCLPEEVFPTQLIEAFLQWQAPWLLLLQHLDEATRRYYEPLARQQAALVEKNHRLYPSVIDPAQINAARVETQLRRSIPQRANDTDEMTVYYIEFGKTERGK